MSPPSRCTPDTPQTPAPLSRPHAPVSLCRPVRGRPPQLRLARPHFSRNPGKRYQEFRAGQRRWDGGKIEKRSLFHPSRCQGTREKRRSHPFPWGNSHNCWEWGNVFMIFGIYCLMTLKTYFKQLQSLPTKDSKRYLKHNAVSYNWNILNKLLSYLFCFNFVNTIM